MAWVALLLPQAPLEERLEKCVCSTSLVIYSLQVAASDYWGHVLGNAGDDTQAYLSLALPGVKARVNI